VSIKLDKRIYNFGTFQDAGDDSITSTTPDLGKPAGNQAFVTERDGTEGGGKWRND